MTTFRKGSETNIKTEKKISQEKKPVKNISEPVIKRQRQEHRTQPAQKQRSRN